MNEIKKDNETTAPVKTSIELFAGAGGLALGIEEAHFKHIGLVEWDKDAAKTLATNRPSWRVLCKDIRELSSKNLCDLFDIQQGELDLLSGGCPCQAFSYAGNKKGLDDERGQLYLHYAEFLRQLQPKMFLFENVPGLVTHNIGVTFLEISSKLVDCGYAIKYKVLNAYDYGVPQKRERLIMIGIRKDLPWEFHFPKPYDKHYTVGEALENCPTSVGVTYSAAKEALFALVPEGGNWKDIDQGIAAEYMGSSYYAGGGKTGILRRLSRSEPSLTILTSPSQKQTERCHPTENRPLTVRESARIQTFPDEWQFTGSVSSQYKQVGNAVPVELAYAVAKEIYDLLCMHDEIV